MADRAGLTLVGVIFAGVTVAVMLTTTIVVMCYSGGEVPAKSAGIEAHEYGLSGAGLVEVRSRP